MEHSLQPVGGGFQVMITNGGLHTARQWAQAAANKIVRPEGGSMPTERFEKIERLRREIVEVLEPFFRKPLSADAELALRSVNDVAEKSEWALAFSEPNIQTMIRRSLVSTLGAAAETGVA